MTLAPQPLPNDVAALQAIIAKQTKELDEREAALEEAKAALSDAKTKLEARDLIIEQLQLNLDKLKRSQFGRSSEKVQRQIDQLELALEDLQTDRAAEQAEENDEAGGQAEADDKQGKPKRRRGRKKLPAHLPRERSVLDPGETCPDCGGELRLLGEDINELLDYVSAKLKVLQIARLKKSCRLCEKIVQPSTPIQRGMAGAGLLSHILVSKFDDHLPLYRLC